MRVAIVYEARGEYQLVVDPKRPARARCATS
jgi:hypothetical protein